jgi:2'-5' RNA ligase
MNNTIVKLNIAIVPSSEVINEVINLSRDLSKENSTEFILDGVNYYPHITVYSANYSFEKINLVSQKLKEILKNLNSLNCIYSGISLERRYLGVEFKLTSQIKRFHEIITDELSLFRENDNVSDYGIKLSEEEKVNITKYGYPSAKKLYHPHLTITRFENEKETKKIDWNIKAFQAKEIGIYVMGKNGTCVDLLESIIIENKTL